MDTEEPIEPKIHSEYQGKRVYLCCPRCRRKFLNDPEAYVKNLPQFAARSAPKPKAPTPPRATIKPAAVTEQPLAKEAQARAPLPHAKEPEPAKQASSQGRATLLRPPPSPAADGHDAHSHHADRPQEAELAAIKPRAPERSSELLQVKTPRSARAREHDPNPRHDHATDHGQPQRARRLVAFLGKFHPVVVHFPLALILVAGLMELLALAMGRTVFRDVARLNLLVGAISVVAAAALGWSAGAFSHYPGDLKAVLVWHRWSGTAAAVLILATAVLAEACHRQRGWAPAWLYRGCLFVSCALVAIVGHLGGALVFGTDHFAF